MVYQINPDAPKQQGQLAQTDEKNLYHGDTNNHGNQERDLHRRETVPSYFMQQTSDFDVLCRSVPLTNQQPCDQTSRSASVIRDVGLALRRIGDKWYIARETGKELQKIADELNRDYPSPDSEAIHIHVTLERANADTLRRNS